MAAISHTGTAEVTMVTMGNIVIMVIRVAWIFPKSLPGDGKHIGLYVKCPVLLFDTN